ncbi:hypothetical protein GGTG_00265 [Gaeumannomyces tritici R3-111a-1]|uniref:Uncharacterized protein n=1 Tax=Gaeumannomyces tritici (strain R3-111a-1) TaxID=644352 RepID=J3NG72_GAET3|nr:hypothetical protein GGTG_00265 [Gaeumannomyces tritici R3-111a-1]EJT80262.1 hypothetical protein GGTG_00265 [Gaeumannomyces tritici R3-111a-1]
MCKRNLMPSLLLERAARRLPTDHTAAAYPSNRVWVEDKESFPRMLRRAGYAVEEAVVVLGGISGRGDVEYGAGRVRGGAGGRAVRAGRAVVPHGWAGRRRVGGEGEAAVSRGVGQGRGWREGGECRCCLCLPC